MARLGELLASTRLIEPDKVEQALRAQVVWGGRLGTNLIELGCIDLDGLSRALGRQHAVPAALARHFDKADAELQKKFPAELARKWSVVPLLRVGPEQKIALAALDPLPAEALVAIADAFKCAESTLVVSIAAEMRVRYHLERVYQIARSARYLRTKGKTIPPFPQFGEDFDVETDAEVIVQQGTPQPVTEKPTGRAAVPPPPVNPDDLSALIDAAIDQAIDIEVGVDAEPRGRDRRTYVKTLADQIEAKLPPVPTITSAFPAIKEPPPDDDGVLNPPTSLGRMAIKRVVVGGEGDAKGPATLQDAAKAIRRALSRDRVAQLAIEALDEFVPQCAAGLLLVIRGEIAAGWMHFSRANTSTADVALPLDEPGLATRAIMHNMTARGMPDDLGPLDQALLHSLVDDSNDHHLAICPISIAGQVMCLLVAVVDHTSPSTALEVVASAAGAAFTRLIRDASR